MTSKLKTAEWISWGLGPRIVFGVRYLDDKKKALEIFALEYENLEEEYEEKINIGKILLDIANEKVNRIKKNKLKQAIIPAKSIKK